PQFKYVVEVTLIFTAANIVLSMTLATIIALLMERVSSFVRVLLGAGLVFVWATPVIPAIDLWQWMFDYEFGVINWLLTRIGAGNYIHHNWFENPVQGFTVITVVVVWGAIPFLALTLHAGLTQVPRELIEAAQIDGARSWEILSLDPYWFPAPVTFENFTSAMQVPFFWNDVVNSLTVVLSVVGISIVISFLAAVAVARFGFRGRTAFIVMVIGVQMVPLNALVIPIYLLLDSVGQVDSLLGVIAYYLAVVLPFMVWTLRGFVHNIPIDLEE